MREFAKSVASYTWALSVFGVQQVVNLLTLGQGPEQTAKARQALDSVTDATTQTFDPTLKNMFGAGDQLQQQVVDLMLGGFMSGGLDPKRWIQMGNDTIQRITDVGNRSAHGVVGAPPITAQAPPPSQNFPAQDPSAPPPGVGWGPMPSN